MVLTKLLLLDKQLTDHITQLTQKPMMIGFLKLFSHSADSLIVIPVLVLLWFIKPELQPTLTEPIAFSLGIATLITVIFKFTIRRERPVIETRGLTHKTDPYTFPSGHSMRSSAIAWAVLFSGHYTVAFILLCWAALIGTARIAKGMHYFSDIIGGYAVGLGTAAAVSIFL